MLKSAAVSLLVFDQLSLNLGGKVIVDDLNLRLAEKDRVGLVGPNGSGKSSLLRLIAGEQTPDGGTVRTRRGARLGYLTQDVSAEAGQKLLPFVLDSVPGRAELTDELAQAEAELDRAQGEGDADDPGYQERLLDLAGRLADLHERVAHFEAHFTEHEALRILSGLGFPEGDRYRDLGELSGGWRMRAVLASLLFQRPDLLLLDEPTNHLDMPSVAWFSKFMRRYDRAFVLISHDREFLNEQIDRVVSFEPEGVRSYPGDYEHYRKQRAEESVLLEARARNLQREREHLEKFVERFRAKASKASQVQSRVKQLEKMEKVDLQGHHAAIRFSFPKTEQPSREVLKVQELSKAYGDLKVLENVNLYVERGDRIALIGHNGAGKTTLLRVLAGELPKTSGGYKFGNKTKVGYYAQHHAEVLTKDQTVYDAVFQRCPDGGKQRTRAVLGALLFGDREIDKTVGVLSGGERARVALGQLLVDPGNVLLMDEPTNHLDLESSERLGEAMANYEGTLIFVSHNKAFIRRLATKIWNVADGNVEVYPGTFDDYLYSMSLRDGEVDDRVKPQGKGGKAQSKTKGATPRKGNREEQKARKRAEAEARKKRGSSLKPLRKKVANLERTIAELEAKQKEMTEALSYPAVFEDAVRRDEMTGALGEIAEQLEAKTAAWMQSQEELDQAEAKLRGQ